MAAAVTHAGLELLYRLLLVVALWGGDVHAGYAPHYARNVMERVAQVRDLPIVGCMVSSPRYPLGTMLWVYGERTGVLLHCRVTDVSHPRDVARHLRTRREVELGYREALALCGSVKDRPERCPVVVVKLER